MCFFFFSSRRRHTRFDCDWSSDVCSSDLAGPLLSARSQFLERAVRYQQEQLGTSQQKAADLSRIEPLFDLTGKSGVPGALSRFFDSFSQLSVNPNNQAGRQQVIDAASGVAQAFGENAL